jgi:hypothetical protein
MNKAGAYNVRFCYGLYKVNFIGCLEVYLAGVIYLLSFILNLCFAIINLINCNT